MMCCCSVMLNTGIVTAVAYHMAIAQMIGARLYLSRMIDMSKQTNRIAFIAKKIQTIANHHQLNNIAIVTFQVKKLTMMYTIYII
ncbi:hypothetical protein BDF19DRAFT_57044 [Syncephalis fuscata]|nr:hypothetical protein BDF19DRAFT_57044 [Syncephalis fuscata]